MLLLLVILLSNNIFSQDKSLRKKGITFGMDYRRIYDVNVKVTPDVKVPDGDYYSNSLRVHVGYNITPKINVSLGFGADKHDTKNISYIDGTLIRVTDFYTANTLPLTLQGTYFLKETKGSFFAKGEIGTQLALGETLDKGYLVSVMVGKQFKVTKNFNIDFGLGYNLQQSKYSDLSIDKTIRNGLFWSLGISFF